MNARSCIFERGARNVDGAGLRQVNPAVAIDGFEDVQVARLVTSAFELLEYMPSAVKGWDWLNGIAGVGGEIWMLVSTVAVPIPPTTSSPPAVGIVPFTAVCAIAIVEHKTKRISFLIILQRPSS